MSSPNSLNIAVFHHVVYFKLLKLLPGQGERFFLQTVPLDANDRSCDCGCLYNNVVVESLVITLTILSGLAVTGENLLMFHLITVPENSSNSANGSQQDLDKQTSGTLREDVFVLDLLDKVFHYSSIAIAGIFLLEILLKVCTLQNKFITKPWQIFDSLIVLATVGLEIAFHLVHFPEPGLHSVTYIVVLRLWRIPAVCNMRAVAVRKSMEQEIELYKSGSKKAEDRCGRLEDSLSQQSETIRKLEAALRNVTGSDSGNLFNGVSNINSTKHNIFQANNNTYLIQTDRLVQEKENTFSKSKTTRRSLLLKLKQNVAGNEMETQFVETPVSDPFPGAEETSVPDIDKNGLPIIRADYETTNAKHLSNNDAKDRSYGNRSLPRSEASYNLHAAIAKPNHIVVRPRKRRSSTSELVDYSQASSPSKSETVFQDDTKEKSSSCPCLDSENNEDLPKRLSGSKKHQNRGGGVVIHVEKCGSSASDIPSDRSCSQNPRRKRSRRFASCPEYMFTQRMSITNDESMLIEEGHTIENPRVYDNLGFDYDENFRLQVLAEFDGTKTYCNEDGIPMTSL